jgi:hypothetical protein
MKNLIKVIHKFMICDYNLKSDVFEEIAPGKTLEKSKNET